LMKSMASCTVGFTTISSHTHVGSPSSTHTHLLPACGEREGGKPTAAVKAVKRQWQVRFVGETSSAHMGVRDGDMPSNEQRIPML
jgi:hypothetical protein